MHKIIAVYISKAIFICLYGKELGKKSLSMKKILQTCIENIPENKTITPKKKKNFFSCF